jgi:bifunctional DNA-binding transcriptional regulator/antitoxin component of YhaV-PrlF toxin-antitoxin module
MPAKTDSVRFTAGGQIVIPVWLRKQFHIRDGTTAVVQATPKASCYARKPVGPSSAATACSSANAGRAKKPSPKNGPIISAAKWSWRKIKDLAIQIPDSNAILTHFRSEPVPNSPENITKPA